MAESFPILTDLVLENWRTSSFVSNSWFSMPNDRVLDLGLDKLFWVTLRTLWSGWRKSLLLVTPDTVARWATAWAFSGIGLGFSEPRVGRAGDH